MLLIDSVKHWSHRPEGYRQPERFIPMMRAAAGATVYDCGDIGPAILSTGLDALRLFQTPLPKHLPCPFVWLDLARGDLVREMRPNDLRYGLLVAEGFGPFRGGALRFDFNQKTDIPGVPDKVPGTPPQAPLGLTVWGFMGDDVSPVTPLGACHLITRSDGCVVSYAFDDFWHESMAAIMSGAVGPVRHDSIAETVWAMTAAPIAAVALMHCRNIVTERHAPNAKTVWNAKRTRTPIPTTYHTLKLTVPATVRKSNPSENDPDPDAKTRFHLCRGHFKNLTHPRYKNPGLHWWPAHWRGDANTGEVIKDYKLVPAQ